MLENNALILGLNHVQIEAPQGCEEAARAFYGGILGLQEVEKPVHLQKRGGAWFTCGSQQLHIGVVSNFEPRLKGHPALEVLDLSTWRTRLEAAHIPINEDEPLPGWSRFYISDPWGNRLELLEKIEQ